ncbi:MAG: hypothetical protein ACW99G_07445, partial [Candidatus Thorarchaeota archaeon]
GIGSEFEFKIGLYFSGDIVHSHQFIEFTLDDIQFVGETPPTFDDANIKLNTGGESVAITGASTGHASITNSSNWISDNVPIELTTDLSYSFEYIGTMLSSRYVNSTRTTVQLDDGVHYTSSPNENPLLTFYTFVGTIPDIDDFTLVIRFPEDWTNVTVLNPSGIPKTSSCIIQIGNITIPNNLILANLGWWEVRLESPNYLRTIQTFKLNKPALTWLPDSVYRIPNNTKLVIEIGGSFPLPTAPQEVGISWSMPNGTVWFSESISGGSLGAINSSQLEFGSLNTTSGIWQAEVAWTNGTEVAYGKVNFEIHHRTSLTSHESLINAESGLSVSNFVYFQDLENGLFLMDPAVTVTANWSITTVIFLPDPIQNRWVGTFDTSLIGPGIHLVVVNASSPFFDDASSTFLVTISFRDNNLMIDNPTPEIGLGDTHLATFSYSDFFGVGISGANVNISYTGMAGGVTWNALNDLGGGNYSIEFTAVHSDSYAITISASKEYYQESQGALFILVGERSTTLSLENGTAAQISFGEQYRLVVRYTNGTGFGLDGANLTIVHTIPGTGINYTVATVEGNGYFSIILTPTETGTFTLLLNASFTNHRTQFDSFILNVLPIQSLLTAEATSEIVSIDQYTTITLNFTSAVYGGLDGAAIGPFNPPSGLIFSSVTPLGGGLYSLTVSSSTPGSYTIVFIAQSLSHNDATTAIILTVINAPTQVRVASGSTTSSVEFSQIFELLIYFERIDSTPSNISSATVLVNFTYFETLEPVIIPQTVGYLIRFPTDQIGRFEFSITAIKAGFQTDYTVYTLFVTESPIQVEMAVPIWTQGEELNITLELTEVSTGNLVANANVSYKLYRLLDVEMEGFLSETSEEGVYAVLIQPAWYDGSGYSIRIFVEKDNYIHDEAFHEMQIVQIVPIVPPVPPEQVILDFLFAVLPPIGGFLVIAVGSLAGRSVYIRKKKEEFAVDLANKRRFADADNIIGVIVMHKASGIPIYSRIVKGGFEEGIVAAFISAVTHFREEFQMVDDDAMRVLPISDIIRAVQTKNLICAFVTVRSASSEHNRKIESYAKEVSTYLDDFYEENRPPSTVDSRIAEILNYVYDETMDGNLINYYKIDSTKTLPKRYKSIEQVLQETDTDHCTKPVYLSGALSKVGISEARGCTLVSEAIEKQLIVPCEEHEFPSTDIDLYTFLNNKSDDSGD